MSGKYVNLFKKLKKHTCLYLKTVKSVHKKSQKFSLFIFFDIFFCFFKYGVDYNEYEYFEFYNISKVKRDTYLSKIRHDNIMDRLRSSVDVSVLTDRQKFVKKFANYMNRDVYNINNISFKQFEILSLDKKEFICRGDTNDERNVEIVSLDNFRSPAFMLDALKKNSLNIIECVYKQNKNLNKINSNKLCVLSIVTILNGKKVDVVSSSLKLYDSKNRSTSHVVRGVVDIKTGIINDYFVDEKGNSYTEYNDEKLIDFEIPMYKDAVDVATKCHDEIREILEVKIFS